MEAVSTLIHIRFRICTTEWWSLADFTEESDMLMSAVAFFTNTQHDITSLALVVKMCKYNSWLLQQVRSGAERDCCLLILAQQYEGNNDVTPGVAHILQQRYWRTLVLLKVVASVHLDNRLSAWSTLLGLDIQSSFSVCCYHCWRTQCRLQTTSYWDACESLFLFLFKPLIWIFLIKQWTTLERLYFLAFFYNWLPYAAQIITQMLSSNLWGWEQLSCLRQWLRQLWYGI